MSDTMADAIRLLMQEPGLEGCLRFDHDPPPPPPSLAALLHLHMPLLRGARQGAPCGALQGREQVRVPGGVGSV